MRAFFRFMINLVFILAAIGAVGWVTTLKAYHHASHDHRIAMLAGTAAVVFIIAAITLNAVKPKKKTASRPASPYAAPARRR